MAARKTRKTYPAEINYDEGRCIIRQIAKDHFVGLRLPSFNTLRYCCPHHVKQAHDCLEAAERMTRAGLRTALHGKNASPSGVKGMRLTAERHAWERSWVTRAW